MLVSIPVFSSGGGRECLLNFLSLVTLKTPDDGLTLVMGRETFDRQRSDMWTSRLIVMTRQVQGCCDAEVRYVGSTVAPRWRFWNPENVSLDSALADWNTRMLIVVGGHSATRYFLENPVADAESTDVWDFRSIAAEDRLSYDGEPVPKWLLSSLEGGLEGFRLVSQRLMPDSNMVHWTRP